MRVGAETALNPAHQGAAPLLPHAASLHRTWLRFVVGSFAICRMASLFYRSARSAVAFVGPVLESRGFCTARRNIAFVTSILLITAEGRLQQAAVETLGSISPPPSQRNAGAATSLLLHF